MAKRSYKAEEIVGKLRQVDVLHSQGVLVRTSMAGNLLAVGDNHHLVDTGRHHRIAVGISNRN